MPYDEEGKFVYPVPARKGRPVRRSSVPPSAAPPTTPLPFPLSRNEISATSERVKQKAEPVKPQPLPPPETKPEQTSLVLPAPDGTPVFFVQEGNNRWQMSELDLAHIWNAQVWPAGLKLATTDGLPVEVVYRGRWSGGFGPDFKGAIVRVGEQLLKGAVELHLRSQDWRLHGHHQDSRYNEVVLQVVLEDNSAAGEPIETQAGQRPPILALLPLFRQADARLAATLDAAKASGTRLGSLSESDGPCCDRVAEHQTDLTALLTRLDELGERRFEERVSRFEVAAWADGDNEPSGATQALWAGLLEALGYSQNKTSFRQLAATLPLSAIVELDHEARRRKESQEERLLNLEAVLLGTAGLLPSQRRLKAEKRRVAESPARFDPFTDELPEPEDFAASRYTDELEGRWDWQSRHLKAILAEWQPLHEKDWTFARLRPPNHPARRLAGLARLLVRWQLSDAADLIERLAAPLEELPAQVAKSLNASLRVELEEADTDSAAFWLRRFDFSDRALMSDQHGQQARVDLIGADRAADMVVNIVLPFLTAYGRDQRRPDLARPALAAYALHPKLASNELVENVARQVFRHWLENPDEARSYLETQAVKGRVPALTIARLVEGARRQQGLIYLHHNFCAEQNYTTCPLG